MADALEIHVTMPNAESAQSLARTLVEEELAACVTMLPGARSIYRFEGKVREEEEDGHRVKVIVNAVLLVPSDKLDEDTAAAISAVSQSSTGALRIKMHNKLAALVVLGKYLGMFDQRPQNSNVIYAISDEPMSAEEWKKQYVMDR